MPHTIDENFNPRSPHGERRFSRFLPRFAVIISIHAPRTGSDHPALRRASESLPISIHAPRTGSDDGSRRHFEKRGNFNPRSPHGERRIAWNSKTARSYFNPRSPHGERLDPTKLERTSEKFQSTLPARGATLLEGNPGKQKLFQSTLPARGATLAADVEGFANLISIHAPRTGSDVFADAHGRITAHFNPRSPHGERHGVLGYSPIAFEFQSTLPARGATDYPALHGVSGRISTHAPRTGSDGCKPDVGGRCIHLNPRAPHGERRNKAWQAVRAKGISTHAPRTGSDAIYTGICQGSGISTHAPRTGSDATAAAYLS